MAAVTAQAGEREVLLDEVLTGYLRAVDEGRAPDRAELLARHPDLAPDLERFLAAQAAFARWAEPVRQFSQTPPGGSADTIDGLPPLVGLGSFEDYELLGLIARGGMGAVFRARQRSVPRVVALKVIRAGPAATADDVRRFRNEVETVALLEHPNVVPVYDAGEHDGALYFSMKLYEAGSLADQLDRFAADPRGIARLVAELSRAVHHAHQRGVLHRDLKPSNVLLDEGGRPAVADFGLASRLDADGELTRSGALVGTPNYMAPELADGRKVVATVAADVYGLGAVLYALLTGRPPFRGETVLGTLEQVKTQDPEPPRRLNPRVDRDLETVCLKCLAKDPGRRYASAAEVADDLERWLAGEPVRARRAGRWERAWKWVRRNPAVAGLLGVSALAVLGLVTGLSWHNAQLRDAADRERNQALEANRQKEEAQKKRAFARRAADRMYTQVATKWLASEPGSEKLQREFLEEALRFYQELAQEQDAGPSAQQELANAYCRMGEIHLTLGRPAEAGQALGKAAEVTKKLVAEHSGQADYQEGLANIYFQLGNLNQQTSQLRESEVFFRRSLAIRRKQASPFPTAPGHRQRIGTTLINLGGLLLSNGRQHEAEEVLREARSVLEDGTAESPEMAGAHVALGGALNNLAILASQRGKSGEARGLLEDAIRHQRTALKIYPRSKQALVFLDKHYACLAIVFSRLGEPEKALGALRESIAVAERLVAEFPDTAAHRSSLATSQAGLGKFYLDSGRPREAEKAFRSALATMDKAAADSPGTP